MFWYNKDCYAHKETIDFCCEKSYHEVSYVVLSLSLSLSLSAIGHIF